MGEYGWWWLGSNLVSLVRSVPLGPFGGSGVYLNNLEAQMCAKGALMITLGAHGNYVGCPREYFHGLWEYLLLK